MPKFITDENLGVFKTRLEANIDGKIKNALYPKGIAITQAPTKTKYSGGEQLDLSGIVVKSTLATGDIIDVTDRCSFSPANGSTLSPSNKVVTVTFLWEGQTYTTTQAILVEELKIVTWAAGTDEEIVEMVKAADEGSINLADYWSVGDERKVHLSEMPTTSWSESQPPQTVTFVLMNKGGKELAEATAGGRTTCSFVVGMKNSLKNTGMLNQGNTNSGGWDKCPRRTWCNDAFKNAIPSILLPIFKQHINVTADGQSSSTLTSFDYFALAAEKEVFGSNTYASSTAESSLTQFEWYKTSANRIKKLGDDGSNEAWWGRSPDSSDSTCFCCVISSGGADWYNSSITYGLSPFGCI